MKRRALLIGINDYKLLGELQYARQDAEAVAEALCQYYGFTDQDITLMSCQTEGATHALSRYIEHALMNLTDEKDLDLLVFGFWGHGFAPLPGRRYLCGLDTAEYDLERSAVSFDIVKAKLAQIQAENTLLLLDCCQNRPVGRSACAAPMTDGEEIALASLARDVQVAQRKQQTASMPTVAILNACCEGQKAYEWDSRQHGIFTAHLLDGFEKGFDSIAPLASWTVDHVAKTAKEIHCQNQVPFITIEGKGDISLSKSLVSHTSAAKNKKPPIRPSVRPPKPPQPVQSEPVAQWWVLVDGQEKGPLDESAIRDLIAGSKVSSDSLCWTEGMSEWQALTKTEPFVGLFPPNISPTAQISEVITVLGPQRAQDIEIPKYEEPTPAAGDVKKENVFSIAQPTPFGAGAQLMCPHCEHWFYSEESDAEIECPECEAFFTLDATLSIPGKKVVCPHCDNTFYTEELGQEVVCPHCDEYLTINSEGRPVGKKVVCPHCDNTFYTEELGQEVVCPHCEGCFTILNGMKKD